MTAMQNCWGVRGVVSLVVSLVAVGCHRSDRFQCLRNTDRRDCQVWHQQCSSEYDGVKMDGDCFEQATAYCAWLDEGVGERLWCRPTVSECNRMGEERSATGPRVSECLEFSPDSLPQFLVRKPQQHQPQPPHNVSR